MPEASELLYIKDGGIADNQWRTLPADFTGELPEGHCLLPLDYWLQKRETLSTGPTLGIWLNSDQEVEEIGPEANDFPVIAINFPSFMDGRGFSLGRLLRERYGFKGELRAIGNIIRDQLFYLKRCGFNGFEMPLAGAPEEVIESLAIFSEPYQGAVDSPEPLFKRHAL